MFDFRHPTFPVILFIFGIILISYLLTGCATKPDLRVSTWAGDSKSGSVMRAQEKRSIKCTALEFDDMVCVNYEDMKLLQEVLLESDDK